MKYLHMLIFPIIFYRPSDNGTLGVPKNHTASCIFLDRKQIKFLSDCPMISSFCFLQPLLVHLQLREALPRSTVDTLIIRSRSAVRYKEIVLFKVHIATAIFFLNYEMLYCTNYTYCVTNHQKNYGSTPLLHFI